MKYRKKLIVVEAAQWTQGMPVAPETFAVAGETPDGHVHCNEDGDGLCCARHMDGNPTRFRAGEAHPVQDRGAE